MKIKTAFSDIAKYTPDNIHAVTENGLLIKFIMFIWAYIFDKLYKLYIETCIIYIKGDLNTVICAHYFAVTKINLIFVAFK